MNTMRSAIFFLFFTLFSINSARADMFEELAGEAAGALGHLAVDAVSFVAGHAGDALSSAAGYVADNAGDAASHFGNFLFNRGKDAANQVGSFVVNQGKDAAVQAGSFIADQASNTANQVGSFVVNQGKDTAVQAGSFIAGQASDLGKAAFNKGVELTPKIGDLVSNVAKQAGSTLVDAAKTTGAFIIGPAYQEVTNFVTGGSNFEKAKDFLANGTQTVLHSNTVIGLQEELKAGGLQLQQVAPTLWQRAKSLVTSGYDSASTFLADTAKQAVTRQTSITSVKPVKIQSTSGATTTQSPTLVLIEFLVKQFINAKTQAITSTAGALSAQPLMQGTIPGTVVVTKDVFAKFKNLNPAEQDAFLTSLAKQTITSN